MKKKIQKNRKKNFLKVSAAFSLITLKISKVLYFMYTSNRNYKASTKLPVIPVGLFNLIIMRTEQSSSSI